MIVQHAAQAEVAEQLRQQGRIRNVELQVRRKDGVLLDGVFSGEVIQSQGKHYFLTVIVDLTERKRAERALKEKNEEIDRYFSLSLRVLAGGVAHEFNNLLGGILAYAEFADLDVPSDSPARDSLAEIRSAAERAAVLTRQLQAYAGRAPFVLERLSLSATIEQMKPLLMASVPKTRRLVFDLDPELLLIKADAQQIRQVIANLVINASETLGNRASADGIAGTIQLRTWSQPCDARYFECQGITEPPLDGTYVVLEIGDDGPGMTDDTRAQIFDPFFSTKLGGRGLGLAAVHGIVEGHRGGISVDSAVGAGTRFRVHLPPAEVSMIPSSRGSLL